jgi:Protein of unknown function (DUF2842)
MPLRLRKFIGTVALFVLVIVWALVAMALAQNPLIRENQIASIAYYVIAGMGWVLPAMPLIYWMSPRRGSSVYAASRRRKPFHIADAEPDNNTRT